MAGQAFFINDFNENFFEWARPYVERVGLRMPRLKLPNAFVWALVWVPSASRRRGW